jgi:hypothetical protein
MSGRRLAQGAMWIPMVLLVFSVGANVLQARKIFALVDPSVPRHSRVGSSVAPIQVQSPDGARQMVRFNVGVPTVVYFFSPTCAWCERNWNNVRALAAAADGRYRVVAVATETHLSTFVDAHTLSQMEVFGGLTAESQAALGLASTPHTLMVSAQGVVSHDWVGAYQGPVLRELEDLLEVSLPGLIAPPAAARHEPQ